MVFKFIFLLIFSVDFFLVLFYFILTKHPLKLADWIGSRLSMKDDLVNLWHDDFILLHYNDAHQLIHVNTIRFVAEKN